MCTGLALFYNGAVLNWPRRSALLFVSEFFCSCFGWFRNPALATVLRPAALLLCGVMFFWAGNDYISPMLSEVRHNGID
jgi:hypothetical protein